VAVDSDAKWAAIMFVGLVAFAIVLIALYV
jgi:hypothetical protein